MARTKTKAPEIVDIQMNGEALTAAQAQAVERTGAIIAQFGDGLPFEVVRYEHIIRSHLSRSAEEMLAAGRKLIVAKEHLAHGEWGQFLDRIGVESSVAQRMMKAAFKFSNAALTQHLVEAAGNKTKLFELLVLDDEEIKELSDGGTVAGLELDDIARMSASELRKALREEREEAKAKEQVLSARNDKLNKVEAELERTKTRLRSVTPDDEIAHLRQEFSAQIHGVETLIRTTLDEGIRLLQDIAGTDPGTDVFISTSLQQVKAALDSLCADLGVTLTPAAAPVWATAEA